MTGDFYDGESVSLSTMFCFCLEYSSTLKVWSVLILVDRAAI